MLLASKSYFQFSPIRRDTRNYYWHYEYFMNKERGQCRLKIDEQLFIFSFALSQFHNLEVIFDIFNYKNCTSKRDLNCNENKGK